MLSLAVLGTVTDAVFGYALEHSGIAERLRTTPGEQARRIAFQLALADAYTRFRQRHPDAVAQLFDRHFLEGGAAPLLARFLTGGPEPTGAELAAAYADQFWSRPAHDERVPAVTPAADDFVRLLKAGLRASDELRPLVDGAVLDQVARSTGDSAALLARIETLHERLVRVMEAAHAAPGAPPSAADFVSAPPRTPADPPGESAQGVPTLFMTPRLPVQGIVGRETVLDQVLQRLGAEALQRDGNPVVLQGMGGIGKTTLVIAVGRLPPVVEHFTGGVLWASLGPRPNLRAQLQLWGDLLGMDLRPEHDLAACRERLRHALHGRRALLLVDDVWEVEHARHFDVAGPEGCLLFTTRETRVAYPLATRAGTIPVGVLSPEASLLLLERLAPEAVAARRRDAALLCERLEHLPLALTVAGRLLALESDVPERVQAVLGEMIERRAEALQLRQEEGRLGAADDQPVTVEAVLAMSVTRLDATDRERFARSYILGGDPLTWQLSAAQAVWECGADEAAATTSRFIQRGLVERRGDRYWMHALLAEYARLLYGRLHPDVAPAR